MVDQIRTAPGTGPIALPATPDTTAVPTEATTTVPATTVPAGTTPGRDKASTGPLDDPGVPQRLSAFALPAANASTQPTANNAQVADFKRRAADLTEHMCSASPEDLPALQQQAAALALEAEQLPEQAKAQVQDQLSQVVAINQTLGGILGGLGGAGSTVEQMAEFMMDPSKADKVRAGLGDLARTLGGANPALGQKLQALGEKIIESNGAQRLMEMLKNAPTETLGKIASWIGKASGLAGASGMLTALKDGFDGIREGNWSKVGDAFKGLKEGAKGLLESFKFIGNFVEKLASKLPAGLKSALGPLLAIPDAINAGVKFVSSLMDDAKRTIRNVGTAALDLISASAEILSIIPPLAPATKAVSCVSGIGSAVLGWLPWPAELDAPL
ncbi:MAG: hypothetical protein JWM80_1556 [Cyanobacteria bacterium RYN_339]|nr:hypothetical protein [Cyanobacteria bacterium RYN_339]